MNKSSVKKNNILYILACTAIFIFLIVILFYDKATDTRQQRSVHAVSHWTDRRTTFHMKKTVISGAVTVFLDRKSTRLNSSHS